VRSTLFAILFVAIAIPAQVVRIANHSPLPFHGWKRTTPWSKPLRI
jgi:hypothetical protein